MGEARRTIVEIAALAPLDAKSARVLGGGIHWTPKVHVPAGFVREEEGLLPTRSVPQVVKDRGDDLTGKRFGKFVVKGLGLPTNPARWVVRCDCGAYEHRKSIALKTVPAEKSHCSHCDYLAELKAGRVPNRGPFNKAEKPPDT